MSSRMGTILGRLLVIGAVAAVMSLGLLFSGCDDSGSPFALSIHSLYTEVDLDFEPALLGNWVDDEGDVTFTFEKSADREYKLTVSEGDGREESKGEFEGHLVQLGGAWFLDIYPKNLGGGSEFHRAHFIPAHTIARLWIERDNVKMAFLSAGWLKERIEDKSVDAAHEIAEGTPVLTCTTEELQYLVDLYANDEAAFSDPLVLVRAKKESEEK